MTTINGNVGQHKAINIPPIAQPLPPDYEQHNSQISLRKITAILIFLISGILIGSYITIKICDRNCFDKSSSDGTSESASGSPDFSCSNPIKLINRSQWLAQPPEHTLPLLELPSTRVIIAHSATANCSRTQTCIYQVRMIQQFHVQSRGWDDIAYNFLIGGDGAIYIGRGWDTQGAHTKGYNVKSICIAFIGNFNEIEPTPGQLCAAEKLITEGINIEKLTKNYKLYGHRQLIASDSPGAKLYNIIKTWDHWTE